MLPIFIFSHLQDKFIDIIVEYLCGCTEYLNQLNQKHLLQSLNEGYIQHTLSENYRLNKEIIIMPDSAMLGTVHQHLFHAVVCSDFILPDTHCTVHWIIQENERIGWSWRCSTRKGVVNESYKEKINRGLINGWDHMMITEPLYRSSNKNDRMGTLLSAWNKSSGLKSCNLLPHWSNLLLADFFRLHHLRTFDKSHTFAAMV